MGDLAEKAPQPQRQESPHRIVPAKSPFGSPESLRVTPAEAEVRTPTAPRPALAHAFARIPVFSTTPTGVQPRLAVNMPGDTLEREADHVAEQVMRMADPRPQPAKASRGGTWDLRGEAPARIQLYPRSAAGAGSHLAAPAAVQDVLRSPGEPLEPAVRAFFEPRFELDFGHVRVHTDTQAGNSARMVNALAYTAGARVVFGAGQYAPATAAGRRLLAHELTHVVQQSGAGAEAKLQRMEGTDDGGKEIKADLKKSKTIKKLREADVEDLLEREWGRNILLDLSIAPPSSTKPIGVLAAGALAFTLGMLKQRADFFEEASGKNPFDLTQYRLDDAQERKNRKKAAIDLILWEPDRHAVSKAMTIAQIVKAYKNDAELSVDVYDPKVQVNVIAGIKVNAQPFFRKMVMLGWVSGVSDPDAEMPDQLLAAVGEGGVSAGIAGTPVAGAGIGYFMYSQEQILTRYRSPDLLSRKTLQIGFPASGQLQVRLAAYGFDPPPGGVGGENLNLKPTRVTVLIGGTEQLVMGFDRLHGNKTASVQPGGDPEIKSTVSGGAITLTIPETYRSKSISFRTEAIPAAQTIGNAGEVVYRDTDEIQVQFSTNGKIAGNEPVEKTVPVSDDGSYTPGSEFKFKEINFETDSAILTPASKAPLNELVAILGNHPTMRLEVQGHTDDQGTPEDNQTLSTKRAQAVVEYLIQSGVSALRMVAKGYGETSPEVLGTTPEARATNRRVVFKVLQK